MSEDRFHRVRLNLPSHAHMQPPNRGPVIMIDDKEVLYPVFIGVELDASSEGKRTLVTVTFIADVEGEVEVSEGLLLTKNLAENPE